MKGGRVLVERSTKQPLGSTAIRDMFRVLEKGSRC
jgi:hypothetical protein